jgi:hypothetical protein
MKMEIVRDIKDGLPLEYETVGIRFKNDKVTRKAFLKHGNDGVDYWVLPDASYIPVKELPLYEPLPFLKEKEINKMILTKEAGRVLKEALSKAINKPKE